MSRFVFPEGNKPMPCWVRIEDGVRRSARHIIACMYPHWHETDVEFQVRQEIHRHLGTTNSRVWKEINK